MSQTKPLRIWAVTDEKPGHLNQIRGLVDALARRHPLSTVEIPVRLQSGWSIMFGKQMAGQNRCPSERPDLILCAGSSTHWPALVARWRFGGRLCVLMRPSWPLWMFDYAIVPKHDGVAESERILTTVGAINRMQPGEKQPGSRVVLLGGPSAHFVWSAEVLMEQARQLRDDDAASWVIADSRRTPTGVAQEMAGLLGGTWVHHGDVEPDWLPATLARTERVWVTPDSVSMVYEALTAGCNVGLFNLEAQGTRVSRGILSLIDEGRVGTVQRPLELAACPPPLAEADRAADWLLEHLHAGTDQPDDRISS